MEANTNHCFDFVLRKVNAATTLPSLTLKSLGISGRTRSSFIKLNNACDGL
jgi:hypothetical protein